MKVKGPVGTRLFNLDKNPFYYPDEVHINGIKQPFVNFSYYLNETENKIKLVWYNNLNTSKMMFSSISSITEIDFSYFNSSQINSMELMFSGCSELTSINFSNFDTSQVTSMKSLFSDCKSLKSLNLSNFNTSKVTIMSNMFKGCISLISLDLSTFNTSKVNMMLSMFYGCSKLEYINISSFSSLSLSSYQNIIEGISSNAVICSSSDMYMKIKKYIGDCRIFNCSNNWKSVQKKMLDGTSECEDRCSDSDEYIYEYEGKCYETCENGFYSDTEDSFTLKCKCKTYSKCLSCSSESLEYGLCIKCDTESGYYPKENDPLNKNNFVNCYQKSSEIGYYLDTEDSLLKPCYNTCKSCEIGGNSTYHNCQRCKNGFSYKLNKNDYLNCYRECEYYFYQDESSNFYCTQSDQCPDGYDILIKNGKECIKKTDEIITELTTEENKKGIICNIDKPFKIIGQNECIIYCDINDLFDNKCVLDYVGKVDKKDYFNEDLILNNILISL